MRDSNGRKMPCTSISRVTAGLLLSFLTLPIPIAAWQQPPLGPIDHPIPSNPDAGHVFTLRHIFHRGTYQDPNLHKRLDVPQDSELQVSWDDPETQQVFTQPPRLRTKSEPLQIERLNDRRLELIDRYLNHASLTGSPAVLSASEWTVDDVDGPDVTDKETVINLAIMAANAYVPKLGDTEWGNVTQGFNDSTSFGWEGDGLRGHIFADEGNKTVIVGLKGTSPAVFDGDGTTTRDKLNDNLFFSCCCGQGGQYFWRQVCDCQSNTYTCNSTCVVKALKQKTRYYGAAIDLYTNVTELYPDSNVWIVGHSLGGAVSSLLGLTFGLPVVTFEAPGDDLAARRLGLPAPPTSDPFHPHQRKYTGARHFGHTADPIFMGTCNGPTATCTLGGYAMESQCHTGMQCVYDTVGDLGWRVGIGYHKIHNVIDNVIKKYESVPKCLPDSECFDCYNWKYFESNGSDVSTTTTTTTSSTSIRTRTSTCQTPGWWGCLDETTTTGSSSTRPVATTTYTTTTCLTPGWFGCKEEGNITITTTTALPKTSKSHTAVTTTSCKRDWFGDGCDDDDVTSKTSASASASATPNPTASATSSSASCRTPGLFFGCRDRKGHATVTQSATTSPQTTVTGTDSRQTSITAAPTSTLTSPKRGRSHNKCKHKVFFGLICIGGSIENVASGNNELVDVQTNSEL